MKKKVQTQIFQKKMIKKVLRLFVFSCLPLCGINAPIHAQTGINTKTPDQNTALDIVSTSKGVLIPRLNNTQAGVLKNNAPAEGMLIYNTDNDCIQIFIDGEFRCLTSEEQVDKSKDAWHDNVTNSRVELATTSTGSGRTEGTEMVVKDDGKVGIGTVSPQKNLHVNGSVQLTGELNVGGSASTEGSAGDTGQILTSHGAGSAPGWESLARISGTIAEAVYRQGTTSVVVNQGSVVDVPGLSYTHTVPEGMSQTLLFNVVGYAVRTSNDVGQAGQGVFKIIQTSGGVATKISSAFASVGDSGDLVNVPVPATLLKSVTLSSGTYTFKVQYKAWSDQQRINFNPLGYSGYDGDGEAMLTKMQVLVYNN